MHYSNWGSALSQLFEQRMHMTHSKWRLSEQLKFISTDCGLPGCGDFYGKLFQWACIWRHPVNHAAWSLNIARYRHKAYYSPQGLYGVVARLQAFPYLYAPGPRRSKYSCCTYDFFLWNPGYLSRSFRRILLHPFPQFIEAIGPVLDKVIVIQSLINDYIEHAKSQGSICAGSHPQPEIGSACQTGCPGIYKD